jgi:hypothetical protein
LRDHQPHIIRSREIPLPGGLGDADELSHKISLSYFKAVSSDPWSEERHE